MHGVPTWILAVGLVCCWFGAAPVRALSPDPLDPGASSPPVSAAGGGRASSGAGNTAPPLAPTQLAPPGYQKAAELGFQEYERGNYEEARARFLEAHRLWPNARVLRALGHCEFELTHYVAAVEFLEDTLVSTVRPLSEVQRKETEELLGRARSHVARIRVSTMPRTAHVLIDGADTKQDLGGAVLLAAGPHAIEAHAPGYLTAQRELMVEGSVDRVVQLQLEPIPPPRLGQLDDGPLRKKWWVWTSVAAVAAAGLATVLALSLRDPGEPKVYGGSTMMVIPVGRPDGATP
jgi:hypothetical protein